MFRPSFDTPRTFQRSFYVDIVLTKDILPDLFPALMMATAVKGRNTEQSFGKVYNKIKKVEKVSQSVIFNNNGPER